MNFFVRKILGKYFSPDEWANFLMKETAESAGKVFENNQFKELVRIEDYNEEERNRIFNEVQVAGIVYVILLIENNIKYVADGRETHWREVALKVPVVFCHWMTELGISQEFVEIWKKLIDLRLDEYRQGVFDAKDVFEHQMSEERENVKDVFSRIEAVSTLSMLHMTRGKAKPDDPLKRHLMAWLSALETKTTKSIK